MADLTARPSSPDPLEPGAESSRPKLSDVAALAGVSLRTASRVLSGAPNVAADKREAVEKAARMLQFQPNRLARELRSGATSSAVGLVVANLANPYFSSMAAAAEDVLQPAGLDLFVGSTNEDPDRERAVVKATLERRTRAMLIVPAAADQAYLQFEWRLGTQFVFLDRPPVNLPADAIIGNDREAARDAMLEVISFHDRSAVIGDVGVAWTDRERVEGVREAVRASGAPDESVTIVPNAHDSDIAYASTLDLLRLPDPPTAFFGLNNLITVGILRALRDAAGVATVLGFDDSDALDLLGVSTVTLSAAEVGRRGAQRALERITDPGLEPERTVLPATRVSRTPLDLPIRFASSPR